MKHPHLPTPVSLSIAAVAVSTQVSLAAISIETVPVNTVYIPPVYETRDGITHEIEPGYYENGHFLAGVVNTDYRIGTYEVTNSQYSHYLNAVDPFGENPSNIYNPKMTSDSIGGISYDAGAASGAKYSIKAGMGNKPVNYVSWYDAARFTNWMHNGSQTYASTANSFVLDAGAYLLIFNSTGIIERNPDAKWWLPSHEEWGKAAYYQPPSLGGRAVDGLWVYPTQSDQLDNVLGEPDSGHSANIHDGSLIPCPDGITCPDGGGLGYLDPRGYSAGPTILLTEVGEFENSSSFYGTFDQAGNVQEWTDDFSSAGHVAALGGAFDTNPYTSITLDVFGNYGLALSIGTEERNTGFRVATNTVPEPCPVACALIGGFIGLIRRKR